MSRRVEANELAVRIQDARPKVIVTSSGGHEPGRAVEYLPLVRSALDICGASASGVEAVIVDDRETVPGSAADYEQDREIAWLDWAELASAAVPAEPVALPSDHPLYILYTSGTTGNPKGVVRDTGGYAVALSWTMRNLYGIGSDDTMFTASDVGWVVGHSYIVYGPLLAGATTVIYEGKPVGTPDAGAFWRVIEEHRVKAMFTAPTALRAIRREDPSLEYLAKHDTSSLRALFLAGERTDPETWHWIKDALHVPVVDHWWQTETGWAICANPLGIETLELKAGSTSVPMPGYDVQILDSKGRRVEEPGAEGNIAIKLPLAPGNLLDIWGSRQRFVDSYLSAFPGYYATGDAGHFDEDGYLFVMGRTDDVINVAGHRISTGSLEEVLTRHPAVAECAVIGAHDELKGQRAAGFVTLKHGVEVVREELASELVRMVRAARSAILVSMSEARSSNPAPSTPKPHPSTQPCGEEAPCPFNPIRPRSMRSTTKRSRHGPSFRSTSVVFAASPFRSRQRSWCGSCSTSCSRRSPTTSWRSRCSD